MDARSRLFQKQGHFVDSGKADGSLWEAMDYSPNSSDFSLLAFLPRLHTQKAQYPAALGTEKTERVPEPWGCWGLPGKWGSSSPETGVFS